MKTTASILCLILFALLQSCKAQQILSTLPKLENYSKGELELRITSFGEKNPIKVGRIAADGTIHLEWPEIDLKEREENKYLTTSINYLVGSKYCKDPNISISNEEVTLVKIDFLYLYKYDQIVGCIIPSTQHEQEHNERQLGSTLQWIYSLGETSAKAKCSVKKEWEDLYSFDETTTYDLRFKKGWNLVAKTLIELEEWEKGEEKGSMPKTKELRSIEAIPSNMDWFLKYWANDELLELEQGLIAKTAITKQQYKSWLPKNLGPLKRTGYEISKVVDRMPDTNINLIFEQGSKKVDITIVDCVGTKNAAAGYTLIQDMASRDWNDKTDTGYNSASEMNGMRVLTQYNEPEAKTSLSYNAYNRFVIDAQANNIDVEDLWKLLETLDLVALVRD